MVAQRIQANYDCLQEMLKLFMGHADLTVALTYKIEGLVDQLQGGAWRGVGAEAFYAEMHELRLLLEFSTAYKRGITNGSSRF